MGIICLIRDEPRQRNDPAQYDELVDEWWPPRGAFAALHWLAAARARLIPPADPPGALLVDAACGGGLLAPHIQRLGYRHLGLDLGRLALRVARAHGVHPVCADVAALPLADECADVVVAGEVLEHVPDLPKVIAELIRVLRPGGTLVLDTLADTWWCRFAMVTVAERLPGGPPRGIHDPRLFVDRRELVAECARRGVRLRLRGLRPSVRDGLGWLLRRRDDVRLLPTRSTGVLFQADGIKEAR